MNVNGLILLKKLFQNSPLKISLLYMYLFHPKLSSPYSLHSCYFLHFTSLHFISFHFILLILTSFHFFLLHFLHFTSFHLFSLHSTSFHFPSKEPSRLSNVFLPQVPICKFRRFPTTRSSLKISFLN